MVEKLPHPSPQPQDLRRSSSRRSTSASSHDPHTKTLKLQFQLNIRKLYTARAPDHSQFTLLWMRGGKKIDTQTRKAKDGQTKFGEKFMMKTSLEYNTQTNEYFTKPSQLQVVMGSEEKVAIAETDLNLAKYSKTQ